MHRFAWGAKPVRCCIALLGGRCPCIAKRCNTARATPPPKQSDATPQHRSTAPGQCPVRRNGLGIGAGQRNAELSDGRPNGATKRRTVQRNALGLGPLPVLASRRPHGGLHCFAMQKGGGSPPKPWPKGVPLDGCMERAWGRARSPKRRTPVRPALVRPVRPVEPAPVRPVRPAPVRPVRPW